MNITDHEVVLRQMKDGGLFFCGQLDCHYEIVWNGEKWEHAVEGAEAVAVVCEDMEDRIEKRNTDYEVDQNARCALEMAVASFNGARVNMADKTITEVADMYFDWLQRKTGRVVLEEFPKEEGK